MGLKLQNTTREDKSVTSLQLCVVLHFIPFNLDTYLTNKPSTRNQFQWGCDDRNTPLCSRHAPVAAAPAASAVRRRAGTPTGKQGNTLRTKQGRRQRCVTLSGTLTRRYCARAIFWGIFRYSPPVMSQAWKTRQLMVMQAPRMRTQLQSDGTVSSINSTTTYLLKETWVGLQHTRVDQNILFRESGAFLKKKKIKNP